VCVRWFANEVSIVYGLSGTDHDNIFLIGAVSGEREAQRGRGKALRVLRTCRSEFRSDSRIDSCRSFSGLASLCRFKTLARLVASSSTASSKTNASVNGLASHRRTRLFVIMSHRHFLLSLLVSCLSRAIINQHYNSCTSLSRPTTPLMPQPSPL
jgi:hypothetical protein